VRRFEAALARQFKDYPAPSVDQFVESEWGEVRITITGDKALLRGVDGSKCSLRNVNGAWKVDLDASGTEPNERRFRVWREEIRVLDEMTREISAGAYGSWIDAKQEGDGERIKPCSGSQRIRPPRLRALPASMGGDRSGGSPATITASKDLFVLL